VIEVTEHAAVADYDALADCLRPLRERGVRLAIDDAGAGFASLRHILRLSPDVIKLDRTLCADIDTDPARHALATALIAFAAQIGSSVVAEGIERPEELLTLRALGVPYGQGFFLARPAQLPVDPFEIATFLPVPAA
jgi:EAL domain-containing protein (putative c-di-GMP-specific phosphodiesterase class I)